MNHRFEDSKKGLGIIIGWSYFLPREVFTLEKDDRPTARMLVDRTVVVRLGTMMIRSNDFGCVRRELVMLGSEIGWVEEFSVRDPQE